MEDDDATLQRLRHAAFSRDATSEDLRRLADLEARRAAPERPATATLEDLSDAEVPPEAEHVEVDRPTEPSGPLARRRLGVIIGAAALGGILVGAVIGSLATTAVHREPAGVANWSGTSSLAVFDRDPAPLDDPGERSMAIGQLLSSAANDPTPGALEAEVRWVGAPGGFTTYAARGNGVKSDVVCVIVTSAQVDMSSCVPESTFLQDGIRIMAFGLDLRWGPTGTELWANSSG